MLLRKKILFLLIATLLLTGCVDKRPAPPNESIIDFLQDRVTTKEEAILKLGFPSGQFDGERILTYRLSYSAEHKWRVREKVIPYDWRFVKYSLVLVFDDNNILEKHSLISVE